MGKGGGGRREKRMESEGHSVRRSRRRNCGTQPGSLEQDLTGLTVRTLSSIRSSTNKYPLSMDHYPTTNSALIESLKLQVHIEGGYFVETDRQPAEIPSPFAGETASDDTRRKDLGAQITNRGHWRRRSTTC